MEKVRIAVLLMAGITVFSTGCGKMERNTEEVTSNEALSQEEFIPNGFIEEKLQKNEFESFDEVISYLEKGQAYAYVDVLGSDNQVLLVTEGTYDNMDGNDAVAMDAYVYLQDEKGVSCGSMISSYGTAYPIALKDGLLFTAGNHNVEIDCISQDTNAVMVKEYISEDFDENGTAHYSGFVRNTNKVSEDGREIDDADSENDFHRLMQEYADAKIVQFTVVK